MQLQVPAQAAKSNIGPERKLSRMARNRTIPEPAEPAVPPSTDGPRMIFSLDIGLDPKHVKALVESLPGNDSKTMKLAALAMGTMEDLATGGILLPPLVVRQLTESLGRPVAVEDIVEQFQRGTSRIEGKIEVRFPIDPADEEPLRDSAQFNGFLLPDGRPDVNAYLKNLWDTAMDHGWLHQHVSGTKRVLMLPQDYENLEKLLGGSFENGTELAALIQKKSAESDSAELFAEETV